MNRRINYHFEPTYIRIENKTSRKNKKNMIKKINFDYYYNGSIGQEIFQDLFFMKKESQSLIFFPIKKNESDNDHSKLLVKFNARIVEWIVAHAFMWKDKSPVPYRNKSIIKK